MSAPRFYCLPPLPASGPFELPAEAAHHANRVLRLREGDAVQLFDGTGNACDAAILSISGKRVVLDRLHHLAPEADMPLHITLAQAMSSSEKMDWIVQKATELGAREIQPVQTQRSVARLTAERADKRTEHWRAVIVSACEQSGRNLLPQVHAPQEFSHWLEQQYTQPGSRFILLPDGASSLQSQPKPCGQATLLIGPEGGFSAEEVAMALRAGFQPVLLGPRVLRTETAAMAGNTALQMLRGDFN